MAKMTNGSSEKLLGLQKLRAKVNAPGDPAHLQLEEESFEFLRVLEGPPPYLVSLMKGWGLLLLNRLGGPSRCYLRKHT